MIFILLLLVLNISLYASSTELYLSENNSSYIDKKIRTFAKEHNHTIELKKENCIEVYFDTPELTLSTQNEFLKYQLESLPKSKKVKKAYKESVLYLTKDKTLLSYPVKHYHTIKSTEEKHPLLSFIKRANREDFMRKLKENGTEHPLKLKYLFNISKFTHNYQLVDNNKNKISILVNKINFEPFNIEKDITTIEIITPINIKEITKELNLTKIKTNPYIFYLNSIKKDNPYFTIQVKYPHLIKLLDAVFISLFLILFFYIFSTLFFMNFSKKTL